MKPEEKIFFLITRLKVLLESVQRCFIAKNNFNALMIPIWDVVPVFKLRFRLQEYLDWKVIWLVPSLIRINCLCYLVDQQIRQSIELRLSLFSSANRSFQYRLLELWKHAMQEHVKDDIGHTVWSILYFLLNDYYYHMGSVWKLSFSWTSRICSSKKISSDGDFQNTWLSCTLLTSMFMNVTKLII